MTLMEAAVGVFVMAMVVFGSLLAMLATLQTWTRGQARIAAEVKTSQALRIVVGELREAMDVTIDANGKGITYRLPSRDANGAYIVPVTWDGVTRRIFANANNDLVVQDNTGTRTLLKGLVYQDPSRGTGTYNLFTPGQGAMVRQVTVMLVTQNTFAYAQNAYGRFRETVALRNLPTT